MSASGFATLRGFSVAGVVNPMGAVSDGSPPPLDEIRQMLDAPSDAYSAGQWCEAAGALLARVDDLTATLREYQAVLDAEEWASGTAEQRLAALRLFTEDYTHLQRENRKLAARVDDLERENERLMSAIRAWSVTGEGPEV